MLTIRYSTKFRKDFKSCVTGIHSDSFWIINFIPNRLFTSDRSCPRSIFYLQPENTVILSYNVHTSYSSRRYLSLDLHLRPLP